MRYSLRTLLIVMLLGGPALSGAWFSGVWITENPVTSIVSGILLFMFLVAAALAVNLKRMVRAAARMWVRNPKD